MRLILQELKIFVNCTWVLNRVKESCSNSGNSVNDDRNSVNSFWTQDCSDWYDRHFSIEKCNGCRVNNLESHAITITKRRNLSYGTCACARRTWRLRIGTNSKFDSISPSTMLSTGGSVLSISSSIVSSVLSHMCMFGCASCEFGISRVFAAVEATLVRRFYAS